MTKENIHVFLVEDDPLITKLIAGEVAKKGWTIDNDPAGTDAVSKMKAKLPDIILLDLMLPGVDGMTILKDVKAQPELKDIPVLMLSNLAEADKIEESRNLGAVKFLMKATSSMSTIVAEIEANIK
jgi:DNA-binding response OmpR family regulator